MFILLNHGRLRFSLYLSIQRSSLSFGAAELAPPEHAERESLLVDLASVPKLKAESRRLALPR